MRRFLCRTCGEIFDVEDVVPIVCPFCQQTFEALVEIPKPSMKRKGEEAMDKLSYGMYLLSAKDRKGRDCACIVNSVLQVHNAPDRMLMILDKGNQTCQALDRTNKFTLSVLSQKAKFPLFYRFGYLSGKVSDKFDGFNDWKRALVNDLPYIRSQANAYFCGEIVKTDNIGSHLVCYCDVVYSEVLNKDPSMTYDYYLEHVKPKGTVPVPEKDIWRCTQCGFEVEMYGELPQDTVCPFCQSGVERFEKYKKIPLIRNRG